MFDCSPIYTSPRYNNPKSLLIQSGAAFNPDLLPDNPNTEHLLPSVPISHIPPNHPPMHPPPSPPAKPRPRLRPLLSLISALLRPSPPPSPPARPPPRRVVEVVRAFPELGGARTVLRAPPIAPRAFEPFVALAHCCAMDAAPLVVGGGGGREGAVQTLVHVTKGRVVLGGEKIGAGTPVLVGGGGNVAGGGEGNEGKALVGRVPPTEVISVAIRMPAEVDVGGVPTATAPRRAGAKKFRARLTSLAEGGVGGVGVGGCGGANVVVPAADVGVYELRMRAGGRVEIEPVGEKLFVYVFEGAAKVCGVAVPEGGLAVLEEGSAGRVVVETELSGVREEAVDGGWKECGDGCCFALLLCGGTADSGRAKRTLAGGGDGVQARAFLPAVGGGAVGGAVMV